MDGGPPAIIDALAATADRLTALRGHAGRKWLARANDGSWSAFETLAHMRSADDIIRPRLLQVVVRDEPLLLDFDERRWQEVAGYAHRSPAALLDAFTLLRAELVYALQRLPESAWQRIGIHEWRGPLTLLAMAEDLAAHEREQLDQLQRALAEAL